MKYARLKPPDKRTVPVKSARLVKLLTQNVFQSHIQFYKLQWARWENTTGTLQSIGLAAGDVIRFLSRSQDQGELWIEGLFVSVDNYRKKRPANYDINTHGPLAQPASPLAIQPS